MPQMWQYNRLTRNDARSLALMPPRMMRGFFMGLTMGDFFYNGRIRLLRYSIMAIELAGHTVDHVSLRDFLLSVGNIDDRSAYFGICLRAASALATSATQKRRLEKLYSFFLEELRPLRSTCIAELRFDILSRLELLGEDDIITAEHPVFTGE